jgi:hypothetical protein
LLLENAGKLFERPIPYRELLYVASLSVPKGGKTFRLIGENVTVCRNDQHPLVQLWVGECQVSSDGTRSGKKEVRKTKEIERETKRKKKVL